MKLPLSGITPLNADEAKPKPQQRQINVLTEGLQKVSAKLQTSKPAPQTVLNYQ
jgi:hypothetical protein